MFHPFPRLPTELRASIWSLAAASRIVDICLLTPEATSHYQPGPQSDHFSSHTPPPALLHACRESRQHAPYPKSFFSTLHRESNARYVWLNFQEDLICFADYTVERLAPHEDEIQRLRFTVPRGDRGDFFYEYFFHNSDILLQKFTALKELHIAIQEHFVLWGSTVSASR